jgi:hypothetical protein
MSLLLVASLLFAGDVVYMVRHHAATAAPITWVGQLTAAALLVVTAAEGVVAMMGGVVWAAMAVSGFLLGVAPMAVLANGNRVLPVLIANRYDGRGRRPLSASRLGRITMPAALGSLALSWASMQGGILGGSIVVIRIGALLLMGGAICLGGTVLRQVLAARREVGDPRWTLASDSTARDARSRS